MLSIVCAVLDLYVLALIIRAVLSFFPLRPDSGLISIVRALDTIIEPVLSPMRRVIPPIGMFDLSFLVLFILIRIVAGSIGCNLVI